MRPRTTLISVQTLFLAVCATLGSQTQAQELSVWVSAPSPDGPVEVRTDAPSIDAVLADPTGQLANTTIHYQVTIDGTAIEEPAAEAIVTDVLDTLQFMHLRNQRQLFQDVANHVGYTRTREGSTPWTAYYPFTVAREDAVETNQSRALLDQAPGKAPGIDNTRVRRALWRDVFLDITMLGSLREALGTTSVPWLMASDNPARATSDQAARAFQILKEGSDVLANVSEVPSRLSELVTIARNAGVPAQTLQNAIDASLLPEGLYADLPYEGFGSFRSNSPFDELLTHAEQLGLGLDLFSLATQVNSDAFDGIAMQLAANTAANTRLSFLEDLLANDCTIASDRVDTALCEGLDLAREEFDALHEGTLTGIANGIKQAMSDTDSLLTYTSLTTSITAHIASLAGAGVLSTGATITGAGVLVIRSLSSIAGEYQQVQRAFLLAHLNHLLSEHANDIGLFDPGDIQDASLWTRSHQHTTLALITEWSYFNSLHQGYSASTASPTGLLHWLTQWIHGNADIVDYLDDSDATALQQVTTFQPLSTIVTLQTESKSPSEQRERDSSLPAEAWTHQFGTTREEAALSVVMNSMGSTFVVGYTGGSLAGENAGEVDAFVRKLDPDGNHVWTHQFGTSESDEATSVAIDASGNTLVAGQTWASLAGKHAGRIDAFVRKLDPDGNHVWTHQFGTSVLDVATSVAVDAMGNTLVGGWSEGSLAGENAGPYDPYDVKVFVRKVDPDGNHVWTHQFGTNAVDEQGESIAIDASGNTLVAGWSEGSLAGDHGGEVDAFVRKLDPDGNHVWTHQFGTSSADFGYGVAIDASGNALVTGWSEGSLAGENAGSRDVIVRKLDPDGNHVWTHQFGTSQLDVATSVAVDAMGNTLVAGGTRGSLAGENAGQLDAFVRKLQPGATASPDNSGLRAPLAASLDKTEDGLVTPQAKRTQTDAKENPAASTAFEQISASGLKAYGVDTRGRVWHWATGGTWLRGRVETLSPVLLDVDEGAFESVHAGGFSWIAVGPGGSIWVLAGDPHDSEFGPLTSIGRGGPAELSVPSQMVFVDVAVTRSGVLAIDANGVLWELTLSYSNEVQIRQHEANGLGLSFQSIHGSGAVFVIDDASRVWAWGRNSFGVLGIGSENDAVDPVQVPFEEGVEIVHLSSNGYASIALDAEGSVWAWGSAGFGKLGLESEVPSDQSEPQLAKPQLVPDRVRFPAGVSIRDASAGWAAPYTPHFLAVDEDGVVWAWGANDLGQLGISTDGSPVPFPTRVTLPDGVEAVQVSAGYRTSYALDAQGRVWFWGNHRGPEGDEEAFGSQHPTLLPGFGWHH